jgi:hypothetical protein
VVDSKAGFLSTQNNGTQGVRSKTGYIFLVDRSAVDSLVDRKKTPQRFTPQRCPQQNDG